MRSADAFGQLDQLRQRLIRSDGIDAVTSDRVFRTFGEGARLDHVRPGAETNAAVEQRAQRLQREVLIAQLRDLGQELVRQNRDVGE